MKYYIIWFAIAVVCWIIGVFGFAQIIGSLQTSQKGFLFTIILWMAILVIVYLLVRHFLSQYIIGCYFGAGIAFIQILASGKIR